MVHRLEVIAFNIESCLIAQDNGADRIELCDNSNEGGTTPSYGLIKLARKHLKIPIFPIIRPRGGDFLYSQDEIEIIKADIEKCKEAGCNGVVFGVLHADGKINARTTKELVKLASPMEVTFHRAFDRTKDPYDAMEMIIDCGCKRILTSGLRPNVDHGKEILKSLNDKANNRIIIMPGSGLRSANMENIANFTGCVEFHSSARTIKKSEMNFVNEFMNEDLDHAILDSLEVREMKNILLNVANKI